MVAGYLGIVCNKTHEYIQFLARIEPTYKLILHKWIELATSSFPKPVEVL